LGNPKSFYRKIMAIFILNSINPITCDSNTVKNDCHKYIKQPEKVEVVRQGVDLSTFREKEMIPRNGSILLCQALGNSNHIIISIVLCGHLTAGMDSMSPNQKI